MFKNSIFEDAITYMLIGMLLIMALYSITELKVIQIIGFYYGLICILFGAISFIYNIFNLLLEIFNFFIERNTK